jgi:hypothetical protein
MMFLECTVAVTCMHHCFWEKLGKSLNVFGMYSTANLPVLVSTVSAITVLMKCHLSQVRNGGGVAGVGERLQL